MPPRPCRSGRAREACHEVRGEQFPHPVESAPELSQMGPMHPVEYFAESIMNPNAVIGKKYQEPNGSSPMTNFTEKMTVRELIDVSAYIASLKPKSASKMVRAQSRGRRARERPDRSVTWRDHWIHGRHDHGLPSQLPRPAKNREAGRKRRIYHR